MNRNSTGSSQILPLGELNDLTNRGGLFPEHVESGWKGRKRRSVVRRTEPD
jgi:hypothetical protein